MPFAWSEEQEHQREFRDENPNIQVTKLDFDQDSPPAKVADSKSNKFQRTQAQINIKLKRFDNSVVKCS